MKTSRVISIVGAALAGGLLSLAIGSCGRAADEQTLEIDSNTNWLMRCEADAQCSGSLRCYCGQCSQPCASSDECGLLEGAECAPSSRAVCGDELPVGGLCVLGCSADAECGSDFSCIDSQCVPRPCPREFRSWDDLMGAVAQDLSSLDDADRGLARYISLANHSMHRACDETLSQERQALDKVLNSLSSSTTVTRAQPVDATQLLYRINMADYDWDRQVTVSGLMFADAWEALVAANPIAVQLVGPDADDAAADSGTTVPLMFADSFISTVIRPDVYAGILDIPENYGLLLAELGIDRTQPLPRRARAGFADRFEIIATRWNINSRLGYLWEVAAIGGPSLPLFDDPLRSPAGERAVIFTLPNGFQGFAYVSGDDRWLPDSSTFLDLATDSFRASAPLTLLREHSPQVSLRDDVSEFVRGNPDRFGPERSTLILQQYLPAPELAALLQEDAETFVLPAFDAAGVTLRSPEPISATKDAYEADVTLDEAAGALLVSRETFLDALPILDPPFGVLDGGALDRNDFERLFHRALCVLSAGDNQPAPETCGE